MLQSVPVHPKSLADHVADAGEEAVERLGEVAAPLVGCRMLQVNSTAYGAAA